MRSVEVMIVFLEVCIKFVGKYDCVFRSLYKVGWLKDGNWLINNKLLTRVLCIRKDHYLDTVSLVFIVFIGRFRDR